MGDAVAVEAEVLAALHDLGIAAVCIQSVSRHPRWRPARTTYRVDAADGRVFKVRFDRVSRTSEAAALVRALDLPELPPPLAVMGPVTVDAWVPGRSVDTIEWDAAVVDGAADLLGRMHGRTSVPDRVFRAHGPTAPLRRSTAAHLERLAHVGLLAPEDLRRLLAVLADSLPARARRGPIHGDLCPKNLVVAPDGGLVSIDNERVRIHFLDYDLARTWVMWPMSGSEWRRFVRRYALSGREPDVASVTAWRIAAGARSAVTLLGTPEIGPELASERIARLLRASGAS